MVWLARSTGVEVLLIGIVLNNTIDINKYTNYKLKPKSGYSNSKKHKKKSGSDGKLILLRDIIHP